MEFKRIFKKAAVLALSTTMLGSVFFAVPSAAASAVGDNYPVYPEDMSNYVYDNDMLMLDPDENNGTMNICGYYGNEPYLIIPERIEGYDVVSIGDSAFFNSNIRGIIIPEGVKVIQNRAFKYCRNLEQIRIPQSVTSIGEEAFQFCDSLGSISLPDSITSMGEGAFSYCISMKSFTFPDGMECVPDRVLEFNDSLTEINMHSYITDIGNFAFWHNKELETVKIPPSVKTIGESALACNDKLKEVKLPPELETIPNSLVAECPSLDHISIPMTVRVIEDYAFYRCPSLKSLTMPYRTEKIGDYAIGYDQGEPDWTKKTVDGFVMLGYDYNSKDYADNNGLTFEFLSYEDSNKDFDYSENYSNNTAVITGYHGDEKDIVIPEDIRGYTITGIADRAFENKDITSLYVPGTVSSIGEFAFANCSSLENVYLCDGISSLEVCSFRDCTSLREVRLPMTMTDWNSEHGGGQFMGCTSLEKIIIPKKLTWVGPSAFEGCTALSKITFPERLDGIGNAAFNNTAWLDSQPDGAVYIGSALYTYKQFYPSESTVTVKDGTKYIAVTAFMNNKEITSVILPQGLESIDMRAFFNCRNLFSVTIPESVTNIRAEALGWNTELYGNGFEPFVRTEGFTIIGKSGTAAEKYAKDNGFIFHDPDKPLSNKSSVSSTDVTLGETVTLNAAAEGGKPEYTYALMYKKSSSSAWTKIGTKYGTASTGSFKPGKAVPYDVMINVKDSTGKIKSKTFRINITAPLKNTSAVSAETVRVGEKVTLIGSATGGTEPYTYALMYKKASSSTWTKIGTKYGTASTGSFKPGKAVPYDIRINVKDSKGRIKSRSFTLNVTN